MTQLTEVKEMDYANYGIDVEDVYKIVGKALSKNGPRAAMTYLRKHGYEYDDVLQHVMMTAYRYSPKYDAERGAPSTYLYRVVGTAINHLMSHHTRLGQEAATASTTSLDKEIGDGPDTLAELVGGEPFPEIPADYDYIYDALRLRFGVDTAQAFVNVYAFDADTRNEAGRIGMGYKQLARRFTLCRQYMRHMLRESGDYAKCA